MQPIMPKMLQVLLASALFSVTSCSLSESEKKEVLDAHNYYRGHVDPIATNMLRMEWDDELAYIAQFWAANCYYSFNSRRDVQSSEFDYVGETLANSTSTYVNYTQLVYRWFLLGKRYQYYKEYCRSEDSSDSTDSDQCADYIQLVWAKSYTVGCGSMRCENLYNREDDSLQNAIFFVCNYGPGGGFEGQQPYATGDYVCSSCPSKRSHCVDKLCSRHSSAPRSKFAFILQIIIIFILLEFVY